MNDRFGSVEIILAQLRLMAALERLANVTESRFWWLISKITEIFRQRETILKFSVYFYGYDRPTKLG